jgi:hypothetical protein
MQAGMTRADIRRSVRMAQLPRERHETILAEVMRRKRLAENVAINAVWRVSAPRRLAAFPSPGPAHDAASCESALEPSEASLGSARATMTIGRRRACPRRRGRTWLAGAGLQRLAWFGTPR